MQARQLKAAPSAAPSGDDGQAELVSHLRQVSLFEEICGDAVALRALAPSFELREYAPGAKIISEGETGTEMFILIDGEASVFKSTSEGDLYKVVVLQGAHHAFFGEGGLLDKDARSATIQAESGCRCLVLDRRAFEAFSQAYPHWALPILLRIARAVMTRLRKTNNDLTLIYNALVAEIRGTG